MRKLVFAAALMLGTAAVAQDATQDDMTTTGETETAVEAETTVQTGTTGTSMQTDTSMQTGTTMTTPSAGPSPAIDSGMVAAASNENPERDARGIPVVSAPAEVPSGANQPVTAPPGARVVVSDNQSAVFQTRQAATEYPVCTREITDNCVQAYERGRRPN